MRSSQNQINLKTDQQWSDYDFQQKEVENPLDDMSQGYQTMTENSQQVHQINTILSLLKQQPKSPWRNKYAESLQKGLHANEKKMKRVEGNIEKTAELNSQILSNERQILESQ